MDGHGAVYGHTVCVVVRIDIPDGSGKLDTAFRDNARLAASVHRADECNRHTLIGFDTVRTGKFFPFRCLPANIRIFMTTEESLRPMPFFFNCFRVFRLSVIIDDVQYIRSSRLIVHTDIRTVLLVIGIRSIRNLLRLLFILHLFVQFGLGRGEAPPFLVPGRIIGSRRTDLLTFRPIVTKACRRIVIRSLPIITLREIGITAIPAAHRAVPSQSTGICTSRLHHGIRLVIQLAVVSTRDFRDGLRECIAEAHHTFHIIGDEIARDEIIGEIVRDMNIGNAVQADDFPAARGREAPINENIAALAFDIRRQKRLRGRIVVHRHDVFIIAFCFIIRFAARNHAIIRIAEDTVVRHISAGIITFDFRQTLSHGLCARCANVILIIQLGTFGNFHIEIIIAALHRAVQIDIGRIDENILTRDTPAGRLRNRGSRHLDLCLGAFFFLGFISLIVIGGVLALVLIFHIAADIFDPVDIALGDAALRRDEANRLTVYGRFLAGLFIFSGHDDVIGLTPNFDGAFLRIHFAADIDIRQNRERFLFTFHKIMHPIAGNR